MGYMIRPTLLFIYLICVIFVSIYFFNDLLKKRTSQQLNLILISIDSLRADHLGVYCYSKKTTPNIDQWADDATVFTNAYTVVPETYPSFLSLMTGKYPLSSRVINHIDSPNSTIDSISPSIKTLGEKNYTDQINK